MKPLSVYILSLLVVLQLSVGLAYITSISQSDKTAYEAQLQPLPERQINYEEVEAKTTKYLATGYPMANGEYPYVGSVACPRRIKLGTKVIINNKTYACNDRTSLKYDDRFDIFTEDSYEEAMKYGIQKKKIKILKNVQTNNGIKKIT